MEIMELINKLAYMAENAKQPLLNKEQIILEESEVYELIDELRAAIPVAIQDAQWIKKDEERIIQAAQEEAINTILEMAEYKKKRCKYLIVMGCLVERFKEELEKVKTDITDRELNKAKKKLKSRFACEAETVSDIGEAIGYYMTVCDELELAENYMPTCDSMTKEYLQEAAKKYLDINHTVISVLMPQ